MLKYDRAHNLTLAMFQIGEISQVKSLIIILKNQWEASEDLILSLSTARGNSPIKRTGDGVLIENLERNP